MSSQLVVKFFRNKNITGKLRFTYCSKGVRQEYLENKNKKNENYGKQTLRSE